MERCFARRYLPIFCHSEDEAGQAMVEYLLIVSLVVVTVVVLFAGLVHLFS
ncbi:MAG: hypothetical protein JOZ14_06595 [Acidobacteria bacterium]|nr:hypothetical protein [Acidobacteriota bacterium]